MKETMIDIWSSDIARLAAGIVGSTAIALAAYRLRSLSGSGAVSAAVMGTGYVALGGPLWFGALLAFFLSSSLWSKWKRRHSAKQAAEAKYAKSGRRDAAQVWANGGLGLLLCAGHAIWPAAAWVYAFVGVMAAVNADTWATEIGALSRRAPRALLSGRRVAPGTSGGVTPLGSFAALAGAAFIGAAAALLHAAPPAPAGVTPGALLAAAACAGTAGAFADSLLGATVQVMYRCRICGSETERAEHCGSSDAVQRIRGFARMTNDAVNFASSALAGLLALIIGCAFF
ncbi:TIGR00297 family protein [Paenibacillus sp. CF384]|nr:TIGR00297 family protein [Paenibacillus sp. CF384]